MYLKDLSEHRATGDSHDTQEDKLLINAQAIDLAPLWSITTDKQLLP